MAIPELDQPRQADSRIFGDTAVMPQIDPWEAILQQELDHEGHLDTPEGRLHAALNVIKNGAMVLELAALDEAIYRGHGEVNQRINDLSGSLVCNPEPTKNHLIKTISPIGAAARSDIDDTVWRRTSFGSALLPASFSVWQYFADHDLDPTHIFTSQSMVKKDSAGNLIDSAAYARAMLLFDVEQLPSATEAELIRQRNLSRMAVREHLHALKTEGLIGFESTDPIEPFTYFSPTDYGRQVTIWPTYQDDKGKNRVSLTNDMRNAVTAIVNSGTDQFSIADIGRWMQTTTQTESRSALSPRHVGYVLSYWTDKQNLLQRGRYNSQRQSIIWLTESGTDFMDNVLRPLQAWSRDPEVFAHRNGSDSPNESQYMVDPSFYRTIARIYKETSPSIRADAAASRANAINLFREHEAETITPRDVAAALGISYGHAKSIVRGLTAEGILTFSVGKGKRRHFSIQPDSAEA